MSLQISKSLPITQYDQDGNLIQANYWKIAQLQADTVKQTFVITYFGYASSGAYQANPAQDPLLTQQVFFPSADAPDATWPFSPASLQAKYANNPMAFLLAAEDYAMTLPFFRGAIQVP